MTENEKINGWTFEETIKTVENVMEVENNMFKWDVLRHLRDFTESFKYELEQYRAIGTVEEVRMLKDYKELYDVYKLIGTIEEFRNLKYKKNVLPIATIKLSKEDMQKMVDEKVAQIELDIQEIRAKAIDEFAERLKAESFSGYVTLEDYCEDTIESVAVEDIVRIAEQMKAGVENE